MMRNKIKVIWGESICFLPFQHMETDVKWSGMKYLEERKERQNNV